MAITSVVTRLQTARDFPCAQPTRCGWYELESSSSWVNATASLDTAGTSLVLTATSATAGASAGAGARYLWADWPVATLYNKAGLPALPFYLAPKL